MPRYQQSQQSIRDSFNNSLSQLKRRMMWKMYFSTPSASASARVNYLPKLIGNTSLPSSDEDWMKMIEDYIDTCTRRLKFKQFNYSIDSVDRLILTVLKQLKHRSDMIIKPADKNLGIVVMSTNDYLKMCYHHLNDRDTYRKLGADETDYNERAAQSLKSILIKHDCFYGRTQKKNREGEKVILSSMAKSLLQLFGSKRLKTGHFYCLPKMHKHPVIGRQIVGSINTITYHTSRYLHNVLHPIMPFLPSVCNSSRSILRPLQQLRLLPGAVIICADVKSLYPSIPIDFGLNAVKEVLTALQYRIGELYLILDLLKWTLENNYLEFDGSVYQQKSGTAMGTPVAVCYANIVLYYLERPCLEKLPIFYRRFIDDLFIVARDAVQGEQIITIFNSRCPQIQLDAVTTGKKGVFLDLELSIIDNRISTALYQKPMNKYLYIPPFSDHSRSLLNNIIRQEIQRYRVHCEDDRYFMECCMRFKLRLIARGYEEKELNKLFVPLPQRRPLLDAIQDHLGLPARKKSNVHGPVITLCTPTSQKNGLQKIFSIPSELRRHPLYQRAYGDNDIIIGRKNNKSIGSYLTHKRIRPLEASPSTEGLASVGGTRALVPDVQISKKPRLSFEALDIP